MLKTIFTIVVISLLQSACGGARSPIGSSVGNNFANISSNSSLTWQAPTTYIDETSITRSEIGGYRVYAGSSRYNLRPVANIPDSSSTTFHLANLGKGRMYVTVTCYDTTGIESSFSSILAINLI